LGSQRQNRPGKTDERVRRTCDRLGHALVMLIQEKPYGDITVQDVLGRASVGRSTFYLHYRDKNDLLLSQLERFLETMSTALIVRKEKSYRVMPVEEMFAHIEKQKLLYQALGKAGRLTDFFDLAQGYFARGIERRLAGLGRSPGSGQIQFATLAAALAGSLIALLRWWLDRGAKEPPRAMDELFHRMVWKGVQG
jgi:AcrR family transcriptional regulator